MDLRTENNKKNIAYIATFLADGITEAHVDLFKSKLMGGRYLCVVRSRFDTNNNCWTETSEGFSGSMPYYQSLPKALKIAQQRGLPLLVEPKRNKERAADNYRELLWHPLFGPPIFA